MESVGLRVLGGCSRWVAVRLDPAWAGSRKRAGPISRSAYECEPPVTKGAVKRIVPKE